MVAGATHGVATAHGPPATRRRWTGSRRRPDVGPGPGTVSPAPADERIDRLVERTCDELRRHGRAHRSAVETADGPMSYVALETAQPQEPKWPHRHATILAGFGETEPALTRWKRVREHRKYFRKLG